MDLIAYGYTKYGYNNPTQVTRYSGIKSEGCRGK